MCTVTLFSNSNGLILTSSRDEMPQRATLPPQTYDVGQHRLLFPKDVVGGGTWLALDISAKRVACLLNGAFENHVRQPPYAMSRGQIVLQSFDFADVPSFCKQIALQGVEPFTLLLLDHSDSDCLFELRWDGIRKYLTEKDTSQPHIWSSATLYDPFVQAQRSQWFTQWLDTHQEMAADNLMQFHQATHSPKSEHNILMRRSNGLQTVSISQISFIEGQLPSFTYLPLV